MAEVKQVRPQAESDVVVDRARDIWSKNGRTIIIACAAVILLGGGYLAYKYLVKVPKEQKAQESIWKAQNYFQEDSLNQALKGDRQFPGFEKIASQYSGTDAGNLADYYVGALALKSGDNNKAVQHLKDFSTSAKQIQARAYKLLGDAYSNLGKNSDALSNYKKAAHEFEADRDGSAEYLFVAAFFADRVVNDKKEAIDLYKELQRKYPHSQYGLEADKYLAQAGVYKTEE
jgi:predicted negative regulator of RcsB-dependent stress response